MKYLRFRLLVNAAFLKYLVAGVTAFVAEYGSFFVLFAVLHWSATLSNGLSYCLGLLTSFGLNRTWTFNTNQYSKRIAHQFGYYVLLAVINLLLTLLIVEYLSRSGVDPKIGKLIAMVLTSLWNFAIFRAFIFSHRLIKAERE